jgi:group I intron endonuclease
MSDNIKGIYLIERINTDDVKVPRFYIGQAIDIFQRFNQHCFGKEQYIDKTIHQEGVTNFLFSILEKVEKQKELNNREEYWIKVYTDEYGKEMLYNISKAKNLNPTAIAPIVKKEIKQLFKEDIGRSIYTIAEKYDIDWKEVCKIRKPLLKEKGYKWVNGLIVDSNGNTIPNWRGGRLTQKKIDFILANKELEEKEIENHCSISVHDLEAFLKEYENVGDNYEVAKEII